MLIINSKYYLMSLGRQCVCSCIKVKALYDKLILNTHIGVITAEHMEVVCVRACVHRPQIVHLYLNCDFTMKVEITRCSLKGFPWKHANHNEKERCCN